MDYPAAGALKLINSESSNESPKLKFAIPV